MLLSVTNLFAQRTENLVIITLDGFRWQELFYGADPNLLFNDKYTSNKEIHEKFWDTSPTLRREKLLPFFWNVIGTQGQLYGNRNLNNRVNCANPHWFSYPGYSEMLTGLVDRRVRSNDTIINPNPTVLEHINKQEEYRGRVAAFSTWEVIPFVIRAREAGIYSKCAKELAETNAASDLSIELQDMFADFVDVDEDITTFYSAFDYLKKEKTKVLYISLNKTDEHAHGGNYNQYLCSAYASDKMIGQLWDWLQSNENYREKTTVLITTDHGRGKRPGRWKKHGRLVFGSGQMWFAVIGPDTPAVGEVKTNAQYYQKQFAKTVASFLGLDYSNTKAVSDRIYSMAVFNNMASEK